MLKKENPSGCYVDPHLIYQQTNELRGVEKKNGESFSTFSASVPRPAFENINIDKYFVFTCLAFIFISHCKFNTYKNE